MIEHLPAGPAVDVVVPDLDAENHPMRRVTRLAAADPASWAASAAEVRSLFEELAPGWDERFTDRREHRLPVVDALERGRVPRVGPAIEVGSGTGIATPVLVEHFGAVVALDLAAGMLERAPHVAPRVQADSARLPLPDGSCAAVVLLNAFLFPHEVSRVLQPDGVVVWVSSLGPKTPIYLSTEDVLAALPGTWSAVDSAAGVGTWCVARRAG